MADDRVEQLRRVPLFFGCDEKELRFIATRVEDMELPAGRVLCERGKSGGDFFILLDGTARVETTDGTRDLGPGDFFGEIALLDNGPRTATVRATSPIHCLVLGPAQFRDVLHQDASIAVKMLHAVAKRLRAASGLPTG